MAMVVEDEATTYARFPNAAWRRHDDCGKISSTLMDERVKVQLNSDVSSQHVSFTQDTVYSTCSSSMFACITRERV
jgi:hypothetical protein